MGVGATVDIRGNPDFRFQRVCATCICQDFPFTQFDIAQLSILTPQNF